MARAEQVLYVRVGDRPEQPVGMVRSIADVPRILRAVADRWEANLTADALETGPPRDPRGEQPA